MTDKIKNTLFSDGFRTTLTMLLLVVILGGVIMSWLFPRHDKMGDDAIKTLQEVTEQIKRVAHTIETQGEATARLNDTLSKQLNLMEMQRNESYRLLLEQYGLDAPLPERTGASTISFNSELLARLQQQPGVFGGENVFGSASYGGGTQRSQSPTTYLEESVD